MLDMGANVRENPQLEPHRSANRTIICVLVVICFLLRWCLVSDGCIATVRVSWSVALRFASFIFIPFRNCLFQLELLCLLFVLTYCVEINCNQHRDASDYIYEPL